MTREQEEKIRLRALEIWKDEGFPEGRAREHWQRAEREIGLQQSGGGQARQSAGSASSDYADQGDHLAS